MKSVVAQQARTQDFLNIRTFSFCKSRRGHINSISGSRHYVNWIQLQEYFAVFSFSCKHWIPKANGKTIAPISIRNKILKGILVVVFSRYKRGTGHSRFLISQSRYYSVSVSTEPQAVLSTTLLTKVRGSGDETDTYNAIQARIGGK